MRIFRLKSSGTSLVMVLGLLAGLLVGCNGGGGTASAPSIYVDAAFGDDTTGTGEKAAPYKTLTKAIEAVAADAAVEPLGYNIIAAAGTYDVANGEVFPLQPTTGIHLIGEAGADIEGNGVYVISGGERSGFNNSAAVVFGPGVTNASISGFTSGSAMGTYTGDHLSVVVIDNAAVEISDNTFALPISYPYYTVWAVNGSTVDFYGNDMVGYVAIDTADADTSIRLRNNTVDGGYTIVTADGNPTGSQLDLGTAESPGNNVFYRSGSGNAIVTTWNSANTIVINAVGNTWIPLQQGADADGHYTSQLITGPATSGPNYYLYNDMSSIQF